jgi:putative PIN family toxin of toxin-antitoxin system
VLRAVLDTNVIVSGIIASKGAPSDLLAAWRNRRFDLVIGPAILREIERVLRLPRIMRAYRLVPQDISDLIELLTSRAIVTPGRLTIPLMSRDPEDDQILGCAIEGHADYVVTGDKDLLSLERYREIPIISPAAFAGLLGAAP